MEKFKEKIQKETEAVERAVREKMFAYVAGGLGLVAGLAWNDAIRAFIEILFPLEKSTILVKFIYAILVTLIVTAVIVYLDRFINRKKDE